jgi:ABC-type lipoprotein release transport system permease subunit
VDLSGILIDIRYSARHFVRSPGLSVALLFTIALGIGSNVTVNGVVRGMTKSDVPPGSRDGVVSIFRRDAHGEAGPLSYQEYRRLNREGFEWIGAARISPSAVTLGGRSEIMSVAAVTPSLARYLNLSLNGGLVISHRIWENDFRGKADVRGEPVRVGGVDLRVSGVAPAWLEGVYRDRAVDIWVPFKEEADGSRNFWVLGKLHDADARLNGLSEMLVLPYTGTSPEVAEARSRVGTLLGLAAGLVFFIACANVATFLVGRASARSHETSLRVALGASRGQLVRGLLSDSMLISVIGGALGALLAFWTSLVLPSMLFEEDAERLVFAPDVFSVVAASAACVGIMIVCGLLPVFVISHDRPAMVLRRESAGPSKAIQRLRVCLVVAQMTSCSVLVISTAFLFEGFRAALDTGVGRRLVHPILVSVEASEQGGWRYFQNVQSAAGLVDGVSGKAWAGHLPGDLAAWRSFRVEPRQLPLRDVTLDVVAVSNGSGALFKMPLSEGRLFGVEDEMCQGAMVNDAAAGVLFGAGTAGRSLFDAAGFPVEIIGVAGTSKGLGATPTIYYFQADEKGPHRERSGLAHFRAPIASKLQQVELDSNVVSASYFGVMGWPVVAGRIFPSDAKPGGCREGVVNQEAADLYFKGNPVGASIIDEVGRRTEIIGVVHSTPLGTFQRRVEPAIYFPMTQDFQPYMTLILGSRRVDGTQLHELLSKIESVPGRGPAPVMVKALDTYLKQTALAQLRIATMIIGASATTALVLSVLGLFGALSDAVRQRRREFAVRIALGAQRRHVIRQVLGEGGRLAMAGTLAGTLGSLMLSRMLARIAPGHGSPAFWVWMAAPLLLAAVVLIASVLPARRASIVNPLTIMSE